MATTDASVSRTYMPFSVGMPSTGASHSYPLYVLESNLCLIVPFELFPLVAHQLLHRIHLIRISFYEFPVVIGKPQEAQELCVRSGSFPCQHCFYCFRVRPHTMPMHHSSQVLYRIPKYFTFRWFALQSCSFMHPKTSSSLSMWSSRVGVAMTTSST